MITSGFETQGFVILEKSEFLRNEVLENLRNDSFRDSKRIKTYRVEIVNDWAPATLSSLLPAVLSSLLPSLVVDAELSSLLLKTLETHIIVQLLFFEQYAQSFGLELTTLHRSQLAISAPNLCSISGYPQLHRSQVSIISRSKRKWPITSSF